ncbi:MAG: UDP-N-acetylmuramoyl-L-alanyl-D-glutamate--2,6-diaminopimelate ligase [Acidobacteriota bacterium]
MIALGVLVEACAGARLAHGEADTAIRGLCLDSRRAGPGFLFAALPGRRADGTRFVGDALARGAVAVLARPGTDVPGDAALVVADDPRAALAAMARRFHGAPDERLAVVGVTGTDGKTSTVAMLRAACEAAGLPAASAGTLGADGAPSALTTAEAPELWEFLAASAAGGARVAAIEVSSIAVAERRVAGLHFRGAVLTSLGHDHLDYHGSPEAYRAAKRALFEALDERAFAVIASGDDPFDDFARAAAPARVIRVGTAAGCDWRVEDHRADARGATFRLTGPRLAIPLATRRPAPWDALNLAAAVAAAVALGADPEAAARGAAAVGTIPGRWQVIDEGQPFAAVVDYAHTPDAVDRVVALARRLSRGRVIVVLGAGGERDPHKREPMGRLAARHADLLVITDDNPRGEDPERIASRLLAGARGEDCTVERIASRPAAIAAAVDAARPGDVVLVLGKGHETTQHVGGRVLEMDDRELLRAALRHARETR